jgi:hypothetical protein
MKHPSVADLLRNRGFAYEADRVDELTSAFQYFTETQEKKDVRKHVNRAR